MTESKIKSSILLYGIYLILLSFIITTAVILSRGQDFSLALLNGLAHFGVFVFHIIYSATIAKKIYDSFTAFLGEADLLQEDIAPVGQFLDLAEKSFSVSPPAPIKIDKLDGKAKNVAKELNIFINEMHSMDNAIEKALAVAPDLQTGKKAEKLLLLINSLADDLENASKGAKPRGRYDNRLKQALEAILANYAELIELRKTVDSILEALKKNNANSLPKDIPVGTELTRIFNNISAIEQALTRLAGFELEKGYDNLPKDFKSADIIRNILREYTASLQSISNAVGSAGNLSGNLADEFKMLSATVSEEKRLISQLRDSLKSVDTQLRSGSNVNISSKMDNILQLVEKVSDNKSISLKSANNISGCIKEISRNLDSSLRSIAKFKFEQGASSPAHIPPITAATGSLLPNKVSALKPKPTPAPKRPADNAAAMLPRHYGKVPESGYNFDSKDYGKYSRL